ncbi:uncharacterized protein RNJ42_00985 [Nakaseomyces bracarensis]|uniref:uncharacterized protein n=1 Tax=Nakaseomyces bracarensis TaxID=273131 RepID=UPI003870F8F5
MTAFETNYVKHISFDDLAPSIIDDQAKIIRETSQHIGFYNHFIKVPPQYNPIYKNQGIAQKSVGSSVGSGATTPIKPQTMELDTGYVSGKLDSMHLTPRGRDFTSHTRSRSASPFVRTHHSSIAPRLPPPPNQKILKHKAIAVDEPWDIEDIDISEVDTQLEKHIKKITEHNTQTNSGSIKGYTQNAFSNLNELEDRIEGNKLKVGTSDLPPPEEKKRAKSFAGMTDAELAQLEDFYNSQSRSTAVSSQMDNFDFGTQMPVFFTDSKKQNNNANLMLESLAAIYPTRPIITYKSMSMNIQHSQYASFMKKMRKHVPCREKEHTLDYRTVMCFMSGRRYTWSSVDWYIENVAKDGDHLVVVTRIPEFEKKLEQMCNEDKKRSKLKRMSSDRSGSFFSESHTLSSTPSADLDTVTPQTLGFREEAIRDQAKETCRSLLKYYSNRLKDKVIKLTVEIVKSDSTKDAITRAAAVYAPNFQIISTVSTNLQIKFRNGNVKLPFFVMKHYSMPTFIIPFEFIDPALLDKEYLEAETQSNINILDTEKEPIDLNNRLKWLSGVVKRTIHNPYEHGSDAAIDPVQASDSEAESVASFGGTLTSGANKKKYDDFETMGYIMPRPTRQLLSERTAMIFDIDGKRLTPTGSARGSRRGSRLYLGDSGMYKIKSMVDSVRSSDTESVNTEKSKIYQNTQNNSGIRKIKSSGGPTFLTPPSHSSNSGFTRSSKSKDGTLKKAKSYETSMSSSTSSNVGSKFSRKKKSSSSDKKKSKSSDKKSTSEKKSIGSMFKKVFW